MQNENGKKRFAGKGYYIALIACIAAVGISGYVFVKTAGDSAQSVSAPATISPAASTAASPSASAKAAAASPSATATAQTDEMSDAYEDTVSDAVQWPLEGDILTQFSQDTLVYSETMADWRTHQGLDIAAELGTAVSAAQSGTVTAVYEDDFLGEVVVISHDDTLSTLYANLAEEPAVTVGDTVSAGETIGVVGETALLETAEEPHLHFEVLSGGNHEDPLEYLTE